MHLVHIASVAVLISGSVAKSGILPDRKAAVGFTPHNITRFWKDRTPGTGSRPVKSDSGCHSDCECGTTEGVTASAVPRRTFPQPAALCHSRSRAQRCHWKWWSWLPALEGTSHAVHKSDSDQIQTLRAWWLPKVSPPVSVELPFKPSSSKRQTSKLWQSRPRKASKVWVRKWQYTSHLLPFYNFRLFTRRRKL